MNFRIISNTNLKLKPRAEVIANTIKIAVPVSSVNATAEVT